MEMVQFEYPRHWKPSVSSTFGFGRIPFSPLLALWGNKNWPPSMKGEKCGKFSEQKGFEGMQMVQFVQARHWKTWAHAFLNSFIRRNPSNKYIHADIISHQMRFWGCVNLRLMDPKSWKVCWRATAFSELPLAKSRTPVGWNWPRTRLGNRCRCRCNVYYSQCLNPLNNKKHNQSITLI